MNPLAYSEITTAEPAPEKTSGPVVELRHIRKIFGKTEVLSDISLRVQRREHVVILGKSGQGKSVTIKCIIGLLQPDAGQIKVLGNDINGLSYEELKGLRTKVGFLFQGGALYDSISVRNNLEFPLIRVLKIKDRKILRQKVDEALEDIGLPDIAAKMPSSLSGGQRKRVALARSLILKPELMLYDEPTTGLDPITSREISNLIMDMRTKYDITSIIITHDMPCAHITADRLLVLNDGQFIEEGSYSELEHSTNPLVRSFLNNYYMRISKSQKIKTGLFTIIGFVLLLAGIVIIGGNKHLLGNTYTIYGTFHNIGGLQTGNNVRFAGINIGTVEQISIINDTTVRVDMRLETKVAPFIKADAVAGISSDGIMGDKLVTIAPGSPKEKVLGAGHRVQTSEPLEMDKVMNRLANVAVNAEIITDGLAGITNQIREGKGSMGRLLYDEELADGLEGTVSTANETMKSIKKGSEGFGENMQALRENVLLRGYFKRKEKKKKQQAEQSQEPSKDKTK